MIPNRTIDPVEIRRRAEEQLQSRQGADAPISSHEMQRLVQELKIHQIEMEMQNEELQRAYAELEALQERYFDLYDLAPVCYVTVNEAGMILEANLSAATMLGAARSALAGLPLSRFIQKEDSDLYHLHRRQLFTTAEKQSCELRMVKPDKTTCWIQMAMSITRQPGAPECRMVFNDITERKQAEELLVDMNVELEGKVELRTRELLQIQKQYLHGEKLAAIGLLSASIAHEFNNPLQSVTTVLKGIGKYADLKEKEAEFIDMALQECRRMGNLIANLQDFYRPSTGKYESIDLHALIDSVLPFVKKHLHTRKIAVVKEYAADLPAINAVADQLKQIFLNLLNNAADACEGGGLITVTTEVIGRENVVVHVRDNGAGIDPAHLGKIFEPFFTTKPHNKGTGLGLSVCYGIVKDHGGRIDVESEPGKGTVFSVFLPLQGVHNEGVLPAK